MLKAIHAQEDRQAALKKGAEVVAKLREMKLSQAAKIVEEGLGETLSYMAYPREHWIRIRTNNPLERIMREIRRRTRVVGAFPTSWPRRSAAANRRLRGTPNERNARCRRSQGVRCVRASTTSRPMSTRRP